MGCEDDLVVEQLRPSGGWMVSDIVDGYWVRRRYFGYSRSIAIQIFLEEFP
jgi:hypothetical protein